MSFTEEELLRMLGERVDTLKLQVRQYDQQSRKFYDAYGEANAAVQRVRSLHFAYRGLSDFDSCAHCNRLANAEIAWPCATIKALDGMP